MANSSKKISKVVAIAMASAMAMSSLSAALVSVSAIADPTASSVGSVDFGTDGQLAIDKVLGAEDAQMDIVVTPESEGRLLDLGLVTASLVEQNIKYTDENGIERDVAVDEVTYKITSGSSYAKIDKDTHALTAKKAGTATLQIKASGTVDLGDSKKEKDVTFTYNVTVNVHEDKEIGLAAYRGDVKLTSDDLNDLAAYDVNNITFKLVSYHKDEADTKSIHAVVNKNVAIGDDSATKPDTSNPITVDDVVAQLPGVDETVLSKVLVKSGNTFTVDADALSKLGAEDKAKTLVPAKNYTVDSAYAAVEKEVDQLPAKGSVLEAGKLYKEATTKAKAGTYFVKDNESLTDEAAKLMTPDSSVTKYYDKNTQKLTDSSSGTTEPVDVYKLKTEDELKLIEETAKVTFQDPSAQSVIEAAIKKAFEGENPPPVKEPEEADMEKYVIDTATAYLTGKSKTPGVDFEKYLKEALTLTAEGKLELTADAWNALKVKNAVDKIEGGNYGEDEKPVKDALTQAATTANGKIAENIEGKKWLALALGESKPGTFDVKPDGISASLYTVEDTTKTLLTQDDGANFTDITNNYKKGKLLTVNTDQSVNAETHESQIDSAINSSDVKADYIKVGTGSSVKYYYVGSSFQADKIKVNPGSGDVNVFKDNNGEEGHFNGTEKVEKTNLRTAYQLTFQTQKKPDTQAETFETLFTNTGAGENDLAKLAADAYDAAKAEINQGATVENYALDLQPDKEGETKKLASVRFYAGTGAELFDLNKENSNGTGDWEKSTKGGKGGITINEDAKPAAIALANNGKTGTGSVKAYVELSDGKAGDSQTIVAKEEYVLNFKVNKTVDFGAGDVTVNKSGGKTIATVSKGTSPVDEKKSISGYSVRTTGTVTVEDGTLGDISADGNVTVTGGKTGAIDTAGDVSVGNAIVGNIVDAADVALNLGASVGTISASGAVTLNDASVTSIDTDGSVTIDGATVKGDVKAEGEIKISGAGEDDNGDLLDVTIGGNVIASGKTAKINIENDSDEGVTSVKIAGDVIARYADLQDDDASVVIGSPDTTGVINIAGAAQGEYVQLGGNGLVTLGGVRATNEVDAGDSEGLVADSTLDFNGFNSGINSVTGFAKVKVSDGTAKVSKALTTTTLDLSSDTQLVVSGLTTEDVLGDGTIVAPVGQVTVNGDVDDSALLRLTGEVAKDVIAFKGGKGLADAFDLGGLTVQANRQADGSYNYVVTAQELYGLTASGKNVTLGEGQKKEVTVSADAALPQGASIVWESADEDVATVVGNGNTATIAGVEVGNTEITAKIVDSTGKDLGYEVATFTTDVLYAETADVIGSEVSVDTASKNMQVGETYNFLVRDIKDTDNIKLSYDTNIVDVKLAQADYNGRGALYTITAKANGSTNIGVSYKGATSNIAVKVGGFVLDTSAKTMNVGTTYSFLAKNVKVEEAGNVQFTYDNTVAKVELANADYNGRGALFTVTALKTGSTDIKATYNNEEATMKLDVVEYTGKMTLDTASYTMPLGGTYTIGVKIEKNGKELTGAEVNAMIASGELVVRDSRTGTIINKPEVLANGNVRVTGKNTEGTTYVMFEIVKDGKVATHASIGVTVKAGATAGGSSRRSVSQW